MRTNTWGVTPPLPVRSCTHYGWPPILPPVTFVLNWWPLFQPKTYKDIQISYSLKYKYSKKIIFFTKKEMVVQEKINIQESSVNQESNNVMSIMLCTGNSFVKNNLCLVTRIVLSDTAGLHLLTFRILEPYLSKHIALDLSHVFSH